MGDNNIEGWAGPYTSGQTVTLSHAWSTKGTFTIRARARDVWNADRAQVVTTSSFTSPAEKMAKQVGVILWDREQLLDKMNTSNIDLFSMY